VVVVKGEGQLGVSLWKGSRPTWNSQP
jgi:hypothetical protein